MKPDYDVEKIYEILGKNKHATNVLFALAFFENSGTIFLSKQRAVYIGHSTLRKPSF